MTRRSGSDTIRFTKGPLCNSGLEHRISVRLIELELAQRLVRCLAHNTMLTSGKNIAQAPLQRSRVEGPARNDSTDLDGMEPPYLIISDSPVTNAIAVWPFLLTTVCIQPFGK